MTKVAGLRMVRILLCAVAITFAMVTHLYAQLQAALIDLSPPDAADSDVVSFRLSGTWRNTCVPLSPVVSISSGTVRIDTANPGEVCGQALTPWTLAGTIGKLSPGRYDVVVRFLGPGLTSAMELGRRTLTVSDSTTLNEVILPMVVNGAVAEKLHYQSIFTVLNASLGDVNGTLQVYSNMGVASEAFCSPLAPAPSQVSFMLSPGAQYFQFTSADLGFMNGWARVRWQGPASVLVSEELTLVAAAPSPCLLVCNRPSTEKLSSAQINGVKPAREFKMPMTINPNRQTAVALINPSSSETATVGVSILDSTGKSAPFAPNRFEIRLRPLERVSKFIWEMLLEQSPMALVTRPESFQGSLIFSSDLPFVASGLQIMLPEGKFAPVPVVSTR